MPRWERETWERETGVQQMVSMFSGTHPQVGGHGSAARVAEVVEDIRRLSHKAPPTYTQSNTKRKRPKKDDRMSHKKGRERSK